MDNDKDTMDMDNDKDTMDMDNDKDTMDIIGSNNNVNHEKNRDERIRQFKEKCERILEYSRTGSFPYTYTASQRRSVKIQGETIHFG